MQSDPSPVYVVHDGSGISDGGVMRRPILAFYFFFQWLAVPVMVERRTYAQDQPIFYMNYTLEAATDGGDNKAHNVVYLDPNKGQTSFSLSVSGNNTPPPPAVGGGPTSASISVTQVAPNHWVVSQKVSGSASVNLTASFTAPEGGVAPSGVTASSRLSTNIGNGVPSGAGGDVTFQIGTRCLFVQFHPNSPGGGNGCPAVVNSQIYQTKLVPDTSSLYVFCVGATCVGSITTDLEPDTCACNGSASGIASASMLGVAKASTSADPNVSCRVVPKEIKFSASCGGPGDETGPVLVDWGFGGQSTTLDFKSGEKLQLDCTDVGFRLYYQRRSSSPPIAVAGCLWETGCNVSRFIATETEDGQPGCLVRTHWENKDYGYNDLTLLGSETGSLSGIIDPPDVRKAMDTWAPGVTTNTLGQNPWTGIPEHVGPYRGSDHPPLLDWLAFDFNARSSTLKQEDRAFLYVNGAPPASCNQPAERSLWSSLTVDVDPAINTPLPPSSLGSSVSAPEAPATKGGPESTALKSLSAAYGHELIRIDSSSVPTATNIESPFSPSDLNFDGKVDASDLAIFEAAFGSCLGMAPYNTYADLDWDGCITLMDYQQWFQLGLGPVAFSPSPSAINIYFEPANPTVSAGSSITVNLLADFSNPVLAWGATLTFDPTVLTLQSSTVGSAWSSPTGRSLVGFAFPTPVSGTHILLATLTFRALQSAPVVLAANFDLGDPTQGIVLPVGFANVSGSVTLNSTFPFSNKSAASYGQGSVAPEAIFAAFGEDLAAEAAAASSTPLPTSLQGTQVTVTDSAGVSRSAPLFYVSFGQVNYQIPPGTATGPATAFITGLDGSVSKAHFQVDPVAPGLFSANANGTGVAAAIAVRVAPDGSQTPVDVFQCAMGTCSSVPIDLSTGQVVLELFGTGIRGRSSLANVSCFVGAAQATVEYAGPQGQFVGLDQVNIVLPNALTGSGEIPVSLEMDGKPANSVTVNIK